MSTNRDLHATQQIIENFETAKENLENIFDDLFDFFAMIDQNGLILKSNKVVGDILNTDIELVLNLSLKSIFTQENWEIFLTYLDFLSNNKTEKIQFELAINSHDQTERFFSWNLKLLTDDKINKNSIYVVIGRDITKMRNYEKQLSDRVSLLGEMAAGVAHEINNPMLVVLGQAQIILKKYSDINAILTPANIADLNTRVEKILFMSNRVSQIIQSLQMLAKDTENDAFKMEDLEKVIKDALALLHEKFNLYKIEFNLIQTGKVSLKCKAAVLTQVFYSLLTNSIEAIKNFETKWIKITVDSTEQYCKITIADSGSGIPLNIQEKLFVPFFSTSSKTADKSLGLGLAVIKKNIENHNGEIFIDNSAPNTTFVIKINL